MSKINKNTEGNQPTEDGRYGIIYSQSPFIRRFVEDYSTEDGWLIGMPDVEILGWWELPAIPSWVTEDMMEV